MSRFPIALSLFLSVCFCGAQVNITSWTKTTNIPNSEDNIFDVLQLSDTGYVLAGSVRTAAKPFPDYHFIRTDKNGDTLWTKRWGTNASDAITTIAERPGGGYVAGGGNSWTFAFLDNFANIVSTHTISGGYSFLDVTVLPDSGFIFTGASAGYPISSDLAIVRIDKNGTPLWIKNYGTIRADIGRAIIPTSDGNFVVAGHANFQQFSDGSYIPQLAYILKIDLNGDTLWTDTISKSVIPRSDAYDVLENKNGEYVIAGWASTGKGLLAAWSANGTLNWRKQLTHPYAGAGQNTSTYYTLEQKCDGGYVATGYNQTPAGPKGLIASTDINGDTLFTKNYGPGGTFLRSIIPTLDGGFFVGGYTGGTQNYSVNPYMVKLDAQAGNANQASISSNFTSTLTSNTLNLQNLSNGALHAHWNFGDGASSSLNNPAHTYAASGVYTVCLKVWNYCDTVEYCKELTVGNPFTALTDQQQQLTKIRLFPLPSSGKLMLSFDAQQAGELSFTFFDLSGKNVSPKELRKTEAGPNQLNLDISGLSEGMYILEMRTNAGTSYRSKVIKAK